VANGHGKGVCRIFGLGRFPQPQKHFDHLLHLSLVRSAVTHNSFLHLSR